MKKFFSLVSLSILALSGMISAPVSAATDKGDFDVKVELTSKCIYDSASATALDFGTYDALTGGASTPAPEAVIQFKCTRGLSPTASLGATTAGVVAGLQYDLTLGSAVVTDGDVASATSVGSADVRKYTVTGSMADNQAGAGAGGAATDARTLTLTF